MAEAAPRTTMSQAMRTAIVIVSALVSFNGLFFVASNLYFKDHPADADTILRIRGTFAMMTGIIAVATFAAALAPRNIGHALAALQGVALLVGGASGFQSKLPVVLCVAMLVLGLLLPVLAYASWRHSRAAWAFLVSTLVVLAIIDFFGAPKVRHLLGVGLWTAMILPGLHIVTVIALSMVRSEYREGAVVTTKPLDLSSVPPYHIWLWLAWALGFLLAIGGIGSDNQDLTMLGGVLAIVSGGILGLIRKWKIDEMLFGKLRKK